MAALWRRLVMREDVQGRFRIGILVMENVFDRLHYLAPATTLGSAAITTAVLIEIVVVKKWRRSAATRLTMARATW
jgi:multisubunit Na+/H+ antiporter MnhG subunit